MPAKGDRGKKKKVPSSLYTREYFTTDCDGYDTFMESGGAIPDRIREAMELAGDLEDRWVLDIGCGRGELVLEAARRGANVTGVDYSEAAIELARELLAGVDPEIRSRIELLQADAGNISFPGGTFDVVFMVDVYEHLTPNEIDLVLGQVRKVLRPGGLLIIHTGPNTWFYKYGYPLVKRGYRLFLKRDLPDDLRGNYDDIMHVNEQNPVSLYKGLRKAGFRARVMPRSYLRGINPNLVEKFVMKLLFTRPLGYFFCTSLLAVAYPSERGGEQPIRARQVINMMKPASGYKVLAIGAREGILADRIAGNSDLELTWFEPAGLKNSMEAFRAEPVKYRRTAGNCCELPFEDSTFDSICSQLTLDEIDEPEKAVAEWARVLKKNGNMVLVTRNRLFKGMESRPDPKLKNRFAPDELAKLADEAGLRVIEVKTLIPDLKIPRIYRGDLSFSFLLAGLPYFRRRGKLLFVNAVAESETHCAG